MLSDARDMPTGSVVETDVCVVGAGPAGLAVTEALHRAATSVCLVESGGPRPDRAVQALARGDGVGESYFRLSDTVVMAIGGTSWHWYAAAGFRARPLDPIDFRTRPAVPHSGWPISRADLEPYYRDAQEFLELGPYAYELDDWAGLVSEDLLPLDPQAVQTVLFQVIPGSGVAHHLPRLRRSPHTTVLHHAHAVQLRTGPGGDRVTELVTRTLDGGEVVVRADRFVLAAGGLGNPRLLLHSDGTSPAGLGNERDVVGRYFMEHLGLRGATLALADGVLPRLYAGTDVGSCELRGKLSLPPEVLDREGLLNSTTFLEPLPVTRTTQAVRSAVILRRALTWRPRPPDLASHLRLTLAGLPAVARTVLRPEASRTGPVAIELKAMAEQAPNPRSRVVLGHRQDRLGMRRLQLDWRLTDLDRRSLLRTEALIEEEIRRSNVGRLVGRLDTPGLRWQISGQWHQLGTTRMHVDPTRGVVDADGRVHGVENLWITGGSVFPSGGYANPTLTIVALALRLAAHLGAPRSGVADGLRQAAAPPLS